MRVFIRRLTVVSLAVVLTASVAGAGSTPAQKCASSKIKAAGKKAQAKLTCWSKAVKKNLSVDPTCITKAEDKFSTAFDKAEAKGGCVDPGDKSTIEGDVDLFVGQMAAALVGDGTKAGDTCEASKLSATGKKAAAKLTCEAKAAGKGIAVDLTCLAKAEGKFSTAFDKAEAKGGCVVTGDKSTIESDVDTVVTTITSAINPPPPTTTTTSTLPGPPVGFSSDVQPIFTASCATSLVCHTGSSSAQGQNLSAGMAYSNIVNVTSTEMPTLKRVLPGDHANSYLWQKITGAPGIVGGQMPLVGGPLTAAEIATITDWIDQGALNN
jgi:hypothetical protein